MSLSPTHAHTAVEATWNHLKELIGKLLGTHTLLLVQGRVEWNAVSFYSSIQFCVNFVKQTLRPACA